MILDQQQLEETDVDDNFLQIDKFLYDSYCLYQKRQKVQHQSLSNVNKNFVLSNGTHTDLDSNIGQNTYYNMNSEYLDMKFPPIKNSRKLGFKATQLLCEILCDQEAYEGQFLSNMTIEQIAQLQQQSQTNILQIVKFSLAIRSLSSQQSKELISAFVNNLAQGEKTTNKPMSMDNFSQYIPSNINFDIKKSAQIETTQILDQNPYDTYKPRNQTQEQEAGSQDITSSESDQSFGASLLLPKNQGGKPQDINNIKSHRLQLKDTKQYNVHDKTQHQAQIQQYSLGAQNQYIPGFKTRTANTIYLDASPRSSLNDKDMSQDQGPQQYSQVSNKEKLINKETQSAQEDYYSTLKLNNAQKASYKALKAYEDKRLNANNSFNSNMDNYKARIANGVEKLNYAHKKPQPQNLNPSNLYVDDPYKINENYQQVQNVISYSNMVDSRGVNLNSDSINQSEKIGQLPQSLTQNHILKMQKQQEQYRAQQQQKQQPLKQSQQTQPQQPQQQLQLQQQQQQQQSQDSKQIQHQAPKQQQASKAPTKHKLSSLTYKQVQVEGLEDSQGRKQQGFKLQMPQAQMQNNLKQRNTDERNTSSPLNKIQPDVQIQDSNNVQPYTYQSNTQGNISSMNNNIDSSFMISPKPAENGHSHSYNPFRSVASLIKNQKSSYKKSSYTDNAKPLSHYKTQELSQVSPNKQKIGLSLAQPTLENQNGDLKSTKQVLQKTTGEDSGQHQQRQHRTSQVYKKKQSGFLMHSFQDINKENSAMNGESQYRKNKADMGPQEQLQYSTLGEHSQIGQSKGSGNIFQKIIGLRKSRTRNSINR